MTGPLARWMRGHRVPRRRLVELLEGCRAANAEMASDRDAVTEALEAERRARLNLPAQVLDLHARIARLESERDDALAEARGAKGALEAARRERDHESAVAHRAAKEAAGWKQDAKEYAEAVGYMRAELADLKRTGYAGPGYAVVRLQPDDPRGFPGWDKPALPSISEGRP